MNEQNYHDQFEKSDTYMSITSSLIFLLLGWGFILAGRWLRIEIKDFNEDLERALKGKFIYATWILSIPFIIRSIYNFGSIIFDIEGELLIPSLQNNTWTAPTIYFFYIVVADLLPITSQLVSMLVVNDDVKNRSVQCTSSKTSDITDDNLSFLEEDNDSIPKLQYNSTKNSTPPNQKRLLSGKFLTTDIGNQD